MQVSGSFSAQPTASIQVPTQAKPLAETPQFSEPELCITDQSSLSCEHNEPHFLIHPSTASEFRDLLEPVLDLIPRHALEAVAKQGYLIHIVDDCGLHPLTIDLEWIEASSFYTDTEFRTIDLVEDCSIEELLQRHFCEANSDPEGWIEPLRRLNPSLPFESDRLNKGDQIRLPRFREYFGQLVRCGNAESAYEFLTLPRISYVAGMVLNAPIFGFLGPDRKVILWDCLFRGDGRLRTWYILHELGHCLDYSCAFSDRRFWKDWRQRLTANWQNQLEDGCVTRYCKESVEEYLAESFAAWATAERPNCDGSDLGDLAQQRLLLDQNVLEQRDPGVCRLLEELLSRF